MRVSVIGTGYVGLVTGACFADLGHDVSCFDVDASKINSLKKANVPFYEPGLGDIVKRTISSGNLNLTSSIISNSKFADVLFVCVGTPQLKSGKPNLSYLLSYFNDLLSLLIADRSFMSDISMKKHLFIKSTIPPGTIASLNLISKRKGLEKKVIISSNPEFLKEGSAVNDFMKPDRVVIGSNNDESINLAKELYRSLLWKADRMLVTSPESSEIIKYSANAFLAMKISFINQISRLSDKQNANIHDIRKGLGLDARINPHFLYSGLGYGGSCFPKDVKGLDYILKKNKIPSDLTSATIKINDQQLKYFFNKILKHYSPKQIKNKNIAVWGLAFKPNTDDMRESVAIKLVKLLSTKVNKIIAHEPIGIKNAKQELSKLKNISYSKTPFGALKDADSLVIATEYSQFWNVSPETFSILRDKTIFDGRNILDKELLESHGIKYYGLGR
tara:strand:+ start:154 stop:1491 length:1338 start_codon:yes stop_codon:yes gene_type:complete